MTEWQGPFSDQDIAQMPLECFFFSVFMSRGTELIPALAGLS